MANRVQLSGNNITGVSGAQHGAQKNAQSLQRAGAATQTGYEFGTELGATTSANQAGTNITGVSGAQHGAQKNAQAMQRLGRNNGQF